MISSPHHLGEYIMGDYIAYWLVVNNSPAVHAHPGQLPLFYVNNFPAKAWVLFNV